MNSTVDRLLLLLTVELVSQTGWWNTLPLQSLFITLFSTVVVSSAQLLHCVSVNESSDCATIFR